MNRLRKTDQVVLVLDDDTRDFLRRLAVRAAVAFTNAALHDRLDRQADFLAREVRERTRNLEAAISTLREAQARLVQAERQSALGLLVAGVSHEVNNALNFIYANAPVLSRYVEDYRALYARAGLDDAEATASAARLERGAGAVAAASQRARELVMDLRRFARPEEAAPRKVNLADSARATVQLLEASLRGRVSVTVDVAPAAPEAYVVEGYAAALHHAVLALLLNAAQAIEGQGAITLRLLTDAEGVSLVVQDDGAGIAAEDLPRVFEPFFTTRPGATGLGLTAVLQTVHRHAGSVAIAAAPSGRGTSVTLTLPTSAPVVA